MRPCFSILQRCGDPTLSAGAPYHRGWDIIEYATTAPDLAIVWKEHAVNKGARLHDIAMMVCRCDPVTNLNGGRSLRAD